MKIMTARLAFVLFFLAAGLPWEAAAAGVDARAEAAIRIGVGSVVREAKAQLRENKRVAPDRDLLATILKLEMRRNAGALKSLSGFYRKYPVEKQFQRSAWALEKKIRDRVVGIRNDADLADEALAAWIGKLFAATAVQMGGSTAMTLSRVPPELPPLDDDEKALLAKVPKPAAPPPPPDI